MKVRLALFLIVLQVTITTPANSQETAIKNVQQRKYAFGITWGTHVFNFLSSPHAGERRGYLPRWDWHAGIVGIRSFRKSHLQIEAIYAPLRSAVPTLGYQEFTNYAVLVPVLLKFQQTKRVSLDVGAEYGHIIKYETDFPLLPPTVCLVGTIPMQLKYLVSVDLGISYKVSRNTGLVLRYSLPFGAQSDAYSIFTNHNNMMMRVSCMSVF